MFLVRIVLLGLGFLGAYLGTLSFQEGSGVDLAVGAAGIAVALLCFFFLAKALWRVLGCMTTFIIVALIVGGIVYFIYSSGILNVAKTEPSANATAAQTTGNNDTAVQAFLDKLPELITEDEQKQKNAPAQQQTVRQIPIVVGQVSDVAAGDLFKINNVWVRLFGLATPLAQQTCMNKSGRSYTCGKTAINKLKEIVGNEELTCTVLGMDIQGAAVSTCTIAKDYDLGVVLIEEGYAVALRNITPVYTPYEDEARLKKAGLWAGQFFMPWDWAAQQQQAKAEASAIKMPTTATVKPKTAKKIKSLFSL